MISFHWNRIVVHGEIRLSAFLWPENSTVKLWNFGPGSRSLETNFTAEGWRKTVQRHGFSNFLQMLMYMSPEQTGRTTFQPDHRTDLYSIGITFYVVLTQSSPFAHNSPMEVVHNVMNRRLSAVHEIRPDLPMVLSAILDKLTHKVKIIAQKHCLRSKYLNHSAHSIHLDSSYFLSFTIVTWRTVYQCTWRTGRPERNQTTIGCY